MGLAALAAFAATATATAAIDCVRVITSPTGGAAAVSELTRIGFRSEDVTVGRLPLAAAGADRAERAHKRGCYTAHVAAHAWAVAHNCTSTLIVEDDVVFSDITAAEISSAVSTLGNSFETLWLGYHAAEILPDPAAGISELERPMLAHAIVFSAAASARIAAFPPWRRRSRSIYEAYDVALWHDGGLRSHGLDPPVAGQRWSGRSVYLDWSKSLDGQHAMNWFSRGTCSLLLSRASRVAQLVGLFMALPQDAYSLSGAYQCHSPGP